MRVNAHRQYSNHSDFYDDGYIDVMARKVKNMSKKRKKKVAKKAESVKDTKTSCPACGLPPFTDGVCDNCNFGRKSKNPE